MKSGFPRSDTAWWYRSADVPGMADQSHSWGGAQNLYNFMQASGRGTVIHHWRNVGLGDIIQVRYPPGGHLEGTAIGHTMIVTGIRADGELLVSYHTSDKPGRLDKPIGEFKAATGVGAKYCGWRLR